MPSNDNPIELTQLTPARAAETLGAMVGQLETVMEHFTGQQAVSASTKAKVLADMSDQLEALKMGRAAILYAQDECGIAIYSKPL